MTWSALQDVTVGGVSVKNYGYGMRLTGGLDSAPALVGENLRVAYRRGRVWIPKTHDQAVRSLAMWIDARAPESWPYPEDYEGRIRQRNANVRAVLAMFGDGAGLVTLQRQMLLPDALGGDQTWTAYAEASAPIVPEWNDSSDEEAFFTVELTFPDPTWHGTTRVVEVDSGTPLAETNPGTLPTDDAIITFTAGGSGMSNPELSNGAVSLRLGTNIAAGDSVVVDCGSATATRSSDDANLIGTVVNDGARAFMRIAKGLNTFDLTAQSGGGTATIVYQPAYY